MTTRREWLAERGLARPNSRGRFSKDATEALNKAVASGVVFDDWPEESHEPDGEAGDPGDPPGP